MPFESEETMALIAEKVGRRAFPCRGPLSDEGFDVTEATTLEGGDILFIRYDQFFKNGTAEIPAFIQYNGELYQRANLGHSCTRYRYERIERADDGTLA